MLVEHPVYDRAAAVAAETAGRQIVGDPAKEGRRIGLEDFLEVKAISGWVDRSGGFCRRGCRRIPAPAP